MKNTDYIHNLLESPLFNEWAKSGFNPSHSFTSSTLYLNSSSESIQLAKTIKSSMTFKSAKTLDLKKRSTLLKNIHQNIEVKTITAKPSIGRSLNIWKLASIAASFIVLLAVVFTLNSNKGNFYSTGMNESFSQVLIDGSNVTLDANSSIETIGNWVGINHRKVLLENSAFFNVTKGPLFSIETDLVTIDVLGTEFFVDSNEDNVTVTVKSGKVRVNPKGDNGNEAQILEAGDKLVYTKGTGIVKSKVNNKQIENELAWINGEIVFNKTSFKELKEIIEDRYGKSVNVHQSLLSSQRSIEGTFPIKSLTALLALIENTYDLQTSYVGNQVNITYKEVK